jgi:hypothetical protein
MMNEKMMNEKRLVVKNFAVAFASKAIAKRNDYRNRLVDAIEDIFDWAASDWEDWDHGMSDVVDDYLWQYQDDYTPKAKTDISCAIRVAVDLFVKQSGGVDGYTVGHLKKAFDGVIPEWLCKDFKVDLNTVTESEPIWL